MRILEALLLVLAACLVAGLYGAVHNQISYTVSSEYFTVFKFEQFDIDRSWPERAGAAWVGWQASWWMGFLIGAIIVPVGLVVRGTRAFVHAVLKAYAIVAVVALLVGLVGLAYAAYTLEAGELHPVAHVEDTLAFWRAGTMHNFSYFGAGIGLLFGLGYIGARKGRQLREDAELPT